MAVGLITVGTMEVELTAVGLMAVGQMTLWLDRWSLF
jgi:hypothetical protein